MQLLYYSYMQLYITFPTYESCLFQSNQSRILLRLFIKLILLTTYY